MTDRAEEPRRVSTAVRFDEHLIERLREQADRRDVSVNLLVNKAVERAIEGWEAQDV